MKSTEVKLYIDGVLASANPIYSDSISIDKERENGEMYRRTKLNAEFRFVADDFDTIYNSGLDTAFEVRVYDKETNTFLAKGTFEKTDCTFDTDNKICVVKTTSADEYDKILAGLNNEFDLISLAPVRESVNLHKRAILQIYFAGDSKVSNIIGNMSYEVDTQREEMSGSALQSIGFVPLKKYANFTFDFDTSTLPYPDAKGYYRGIYEDETSRFVNENGYYFSYGESYFGTMQVNLYDSNGNVVPNFYIEVSASDYDAINLSNVKIVWRPTPTQSGIEAGKGTLDRAFSYARVLLDSNTFPNPLGAYHELDSNDICSNNLNYHYAMEANISGLADKVRTSFEVQDAPTKWGVDGDGKYFVQPDPISEGDNVIPIGWNKWIPMSFWLNSSFELANIIDRFSTLWVLKDAYPLWSAIKVLLAQIDPEISFDGTPEYSQFLYGYVPQTEISGYIQQNLFITPVTNIKKTYYNQAARKGAMTLKNILDMLRGAFQLYWFIDSEKRLRIEHINWFRNGGAYAQSNPLIDLTSVISPMSRKDWSFGQNTMEFEKSRLFKRYEFAWNEECSEAFNGFPIDINNKYVSKGSTNKIQISNFISDIDFIISAPDSVSNDCFVVIGTVANNYCPIGMIPIMTTDFRHPAFTMQNAYMSFLFLEIAYWFYNMSGYKASTSLYKDELGQDIKLRVLSVDRIITQSVKFPISPNLVGKEGLIVSGLGSGEWIKSTHTPEDGMVDMKVVMDIKGENLVEHGDFNFLSVGEMSGSIEEGFTLMRIIFDGHKFDGEDYGYVSITAKKNVSVYIIANTEEHSDYGWIARAPIISSSSIERALMEASGTEIRYYELNMGETVYIGYVKDSSQYDGEDKIIFEIVER